MLVATDVAARGLDLPGVDLVLQFGVPRLHGKDGTFDAELYTHRTGRAGRVGGGRGLFSRSSSSSSPSSSSLSSSTMKPADAVMLYDPSGGEANLLRSLDEALARDYNQPPVAPRSPPSPQEVMTAAYQRAARRCNAFLDHGAAEGAAGGAVGGIDERRELVAYFKDRLL